MQFNSEHQGERKIDKSLQMSKAPCYNKVLDSRAAAPCKRLLERKFAAVLRRRVI